MGLSGLAHGVEGAVAPDAEVPPHPLVAAAETLYLRSLPQACDELLKLASMAPGLTDDDLIRVQFLGAMRDLDERNELGARRALSQVLQLDRAAAPPPSSSSELRKLLDEVRAQLPPGPPAKGKEARLAAAKKAAGARGPAPEALLRAVDALYVNLEIDGAAAVLELARSSTPLSSANRAQFAVRRGILAMEPGDENEARTAFREALKAEPGVLLLLLALGLGVGLGLRQRNSPEQPPQPAEPEKAPGLVAMAPAVVPPTQPEPAKEPTPRPPKPVTPRTPTPPPQTKPPKPTAAPPTAEAKAPSSTAAPLPPEAKQLGKVKVMSRPSSHVTIDGVLRGDTPLPEIELEVGRHTTILECDRRDPQCEKVSKPTYTEEFDVQAGKTYQLKHFFQ